MDDKHLYFQSGVYWQFDNVDQEIYGFYDRFDGGYAYVGELAGSTEWLSNNCIDINGCNVCFDYTNGERSVEEEVAG